MTLENKNVAFKVEYMSFEGHSAWKILLLYKSVLFFVGWDKVKCSAFVKKTWSRESEFWVTIIE